MSAAITDQPSITTVAGTPKVKVCFDQQIDNPAFAKFAVSGTDVSGAGNPLPPTSAASIPAELSCVSLTFPAGTNLAGFSTVEVQAGAVTPPGGGAGSNPQGAAALTGGDVSPGPGKTAGPNLLGISVASVEGGTELTYAFDKLLVQTGAGAPVAARFGYYNPAGAPVAGTSIVSVSDRSVKVNFAASVPATARGFVANDAVTLASQPDRGNSASATPAASGAPDLVGISRVASLQATYDLTYDANITSADGFAGKCQADTPAERFAGTAASVLNATTVRVTFGGLAASSGADFEIVRISDKGGCAVENTLMTASSVGSAPVQNKDHTPGFTSGPDLTGCSASGGGTDVTYTFDELLAPGAVAGSAFGLIDADATRTNGTGTVLQVTDNRATVRFASAGVLSSAVGCTVDRGAITDRQPGGEPSSLNTVKANSAGTPENAKPAPTPPPPTTTPPGPPPAPPTPFVKRSPRSLSISVSCRATSRGRVRCTSKGTLRMATALTPLGKRNICTGKVRVRYTSGRKALSTRNTTLRRTCTYRTTVTFKASRRQRANLRVQARYGGNTVSKAKSSKKIRAKVRR